MYKFVPTTEEHVDLLVNDIRYEDRLEIDSLSGKKLKFTILDSVNASSEVWTCFTDEGVACIFGLGVGSILTKRACPWIVTTNLIYKHKKAFLKATKIAIQYWLDQGYDLENYIDSRYTSSLRWAKWAGFEIHDPQPFGAFGQNFNKITMRV